MGDTEGFKTIEMTKRLMHDKKEVKRMADINYELGLKYYSYGVIKNKLSTLLADFFGTGKY